jgi:hypothetical protein
MAIKFDKIVAGMMLLDIHSIRMGNTTMRELGCWRVHVLSVDSESQTAKVKWNGNRPEAWGKGRLEKLYREGKEPKRYRDQQARRARGGL